MKVHRGITMARQRVSRGGNNLFPRYNTSAAIPSRATVNRACDQHPLAGVELQDEYVLHVWENILYRLYFFLHCLLTGEKTGTRTSVSAGKRKLEMSTTTTTLNVNTNVKL